jgi:hypothetical protein
MSTTSAIAIYFIIWWTTLFAVLPWRIRARCPRPEMESCSHHNHCHSHFRSGLSLFVEWRP